MALAIFTNAMTLWFASAGLAVNKCLQRTQRGARLMQIGEQEVAFGAKFRARVVLDIEVKLCPCF